MRNRSGFQDLELIRVLTSAAAVIAFVFAPVSSASAYTLKTLHSFGAWTNCDDGGYPYNLTMVMDQSGNLNGTTNGGGKYTVGGVFKLVLNPDTGNYKEYVLKNLCAKANCADGEYPAGELIMDINGNLYGTTETGTSKNCGPIYKPTHVQNGWAFKQLAAFDRQDGAYPLSGLTYQGQAAGQLYDGSSPLFGVTTFGGAHDYGTAYKLATSDGSHWTLTDIHDFDGSAGPFGLAMDTAGDLFGTTPSGGKYRQGLPYRLRGSNDTWTAAGLHNFCDMANCTDGAKSFGRLLIDATGNLFGETQYGGAHGGTACSGGNPHGCGVVFERTAVGTYKVLYNFCSVSPHCTDGAEPNYSGLAMDTSGNLFGVTEKGGDHHSVAFELSPANGSWTDSVLHTFCQTDCSDGEEPEGSFILDPTGNLFGTTTYEGTNYGGTVFELTP